MPHPLLRRSGPATLVTTLAAALVIGCGGGGGGNDDNGSGSTTSTTDTGGNTTIGGGTDGGSGNLQPDCIYYLQTGAGGYSVKFANEGGTAAGTLATGLTGVNPVAVPDPSATGRILFVAASGSRFGIYRNTTASTTGAQVIVAPTYTEIDSLMVSRDGTRVVYTAAPTDGDNPHLYTAVVGSAAVLLDGDYVLSADLDSDGAHVVYQKLPAAGDSELFTRDLAASAPVQLTNNDLYEDDPQFSKDGTKVVFSLAPENGRAVLGYLTAGSGVVTTFDPLPGSATNLRAPSFNGSGTRVAFLAEGEAVAQSGIDTCDLTGGSPLQVVGGDPLPLRSLYWTNATGRAVGISGFHLRVKRGRK